MSRVVLNVGGSRFEVSKATLLKYPNTLLGSIDQLQAEPDGVYFFDRNPKVFEIILDFYRTGKLMIPSDVPMDKVKEELAFFSIRFDEEDSDTQEEEDDLDRDDRVIEKANITEAIHYALPLVRSKNRYFINRGARVLQGVRERNKSSDMEATTQEYRNLGYLLSVALYRMNHLGRAKKEIRETILKYGEDLETACLDTMLDDRVEAIRQGLITVVVGAGVIFLLQRNRVAISSFLSSLPSKLGFS
ncbi:hypothetical protein PROFUN_08129 [Planoprotostelium fungivorum]|uniref:BTB domain-containing protein n=1 Tax=Planoprotostelium fungivorum TaxID=1890364 RepID=A0A2P6MQH9_9EUKA|nr:hypothetical protein PROFUN_08129 [Planoprotostelium fungivorum]